MSSSAVLLGVPVANYSQEGGLWLHECTVTGSIFTILVGANIIIVFDFFFRLLVMLNTNSCALEDPLCNAVPGIKSLCMQGTLYQ